MGGAGAGEGVLIVARLLQGAAAGILQPLSMQVIYQVFPPERRGSAMGIYGIGVVLAPALGPTLGGLMVDSYSWRDVFFASVPICVLGLVSAMLFLPGRAESGPARRDFDWIGFELCRWSFCSPCSTVFPTDSATAGCPTRSSLTSGWPSSPASGSFSGNCTAALMLNLKLFGNRMFSAASVVAFIFGAGSSARPIVAAVRADDPGLPRHAGRTAADPAGLVLAVVFPIAGRLTDRTPAHVAVTFGLLLFAFSSFLLTGVDVNTPFWQLAWWIILGRIGLGFVMPSLNAGALKALPFTLIGQGSGAINFMRQLGGAFGVNLLSILLERRSQLYVQTFTDGQDASNGATADLLRGVTALYAESGVPEAIRQASALDYLGRVVQAQGGMMGYRDSFLTVGVIFLVALVPVSSSQQRAGLPCRRARS